MQRYSHIPCHIHALFFPLSLVNHGVKMLSGKFQEQVTLRESHVHIALITTNQCTSLYFKTSHFCALSLCYTLYLQCSLKANILSSLGPQHAIGRSQDL